LGSGKWGARILVYLICSSRAWEGGVELMVGEEKEKRREEIEFFVCVREREKTKL